MRRIELFTQDEYENLSGEDLTGFTEEKRDELFKRIFWRVDVESQIQTRTELEQRGFESVQTYLNVRDFYLLSVNRNPAEQRAFEEWSFFGHEAHLLMIADLESSPEAFIEIPPCPDDYQPAEWLIEKTAEKGIRVFVE